MLNVVVIGAVESTSRIIVNLKKHDIYVAGILGHEPKNKNSVSGWVDLCELSRQLNINYLGFQKINEEQYISWVANIKPDLIFAVGFSQMLSKEWFSVSKMGIIGFHPTLLPKGRGRAPLAWLILKEKFGAASFFLMEEDADSGPVFVQNVFTIDDLDDAASVSQKILISIDEALNSWLPDLKKGIWNPIVQNEAEATFYGKRDAIDSLINWKADAIDIDRLIKASSHPHPGAYTFFENQKIYIWKSEIEQEIKITGVVGRILLVKNGTNFLMQTGNGLLWISEFSSAGEFHPKVGKRLGYVVEEEIFYLKNRIRVLNG